ncbi:MAG: DUF2007 domain-containing protein [Hyphomicrobiaceae bacterium]
MHELMRTSDLVLVSFVEALLREQRIDYHVADINTSAVEGSIAIFPRRILVADASADAARTLLIEAGLGAELPDAAVPSHAPVNASGRLARETR